MAKVWRSQRVTVYRQYGNYPDLAIKYNTTNGDPWMSHGWQAVVSAIPILAALCLQAQQPSTPPLRSEAGTQPFVFRVTTREVLVEVLATDRRGHPVRDLKQDELQIFEVHGKSKTPIAGISKLQPVDPAQAQRTPAPV